MIGFTIIQLFLLITPFPIRVANAMRNGVEVFAAAANCGGNSTSCGPPPSCCASGLTCNYRRGIPICENTGENSISGFDRDPCADPYLFRCDEVVGVSGFCCPIGSSCFAHGTQNELQCINALGQTAAPFPSATTGLVPSATPILANDTGIMYSPSAAWNISSSDFQCTTSESLYITTVINATVSFNYTGPSIMVHAVTSSNGGAFWVFADGFNTTSTIDTYSGPGNLSLPTCYPVQFPPFATTPPGYASRTDHNLTLVFSGPSSDSPAGTNSSTFQFDAFAIPVLESVLSNYGTPGIENNNACLFSSLITFSLYAVLDYYW